MFSKACWIASKVINITFEAMKVFENIKSYRECMKKTVFFKTIVFQCLTSIYTIIEAPIVLNVLRQFASCFH